MKLAAAFIEQPQRGFTAGQLSLVSGFPSAACAVALAALKAIGFVEQVYDPKLKHQVWLRAGQKKQWAVPDEPDNGSLDARLSISEAASLTRRSTKVIRGRMDRRTLASYVEDRRRYTTRRALIAAGLIEGGTPRTQIDRGMFRLLRWLSLRPNESHATSYLVKQSGLKRQQCEIGLAVFEVTALVERSRDVSYHNTVWKWIGPVPTEAPEPETARPRPSPRPTRRRLIEQEGAEPGPFDQ